MAISGCDFVCKNKDCQYVDKGFTMSAVWPLGDISTIAEENKDNKEFYEFLLKVKAEGRQYACINLPNKSNVATVGYRIQTWCDKCNALRLFDAIIANPEDTIQETIAKSNISSTCDACNTELKTFSTVSNDNGDGIACPSCKQKLTTTKWFANEKE